MCFHKRLFSLPSCSLHLQQVEDRWGVVAVGEHLHLGEQVEPSPEYLTAVRLVADSTDSMQRNSDSHHTRHRDLGRHNIGRS